LAPFMQHRGGPSLRWHHRQTMIQTNDLFEEIRQKLSRYSLIESLFVVYAHMQYLQFGQRLPDTVEIHPDVAAKSGYDRNYYEWELDLLSRELLQYAPMSGQFSLTRWNEFAGTLDFFRQIDETISQLAGKLLQENILLELGRNAHRTFPWQEKPNHWRIIRYYKIFSDPAVDTIIRAEIGISANELYLLGLAFSGHFITRFVYPYPVDYSAVGVSDAARRRFMEHFSAPLSELIKMASDSEFRDENFCYSQNPLRIYPLVHTGVGGRHSLIAPIPTFLFRRFTAGVYYELTDNTGFGHAFGASFQRYVGEVLMAALPSDHFTVFDEQEYHIGKDRKDTIDWIATDYSSHLFVECKTKRTQLRSQIALADTKSLNADLAKIAEFIFQAYKSIEDAKAGHYPRWRLDSRRIYPIIVLLEDTYLFDPGLEREIDQQVAEKLSRAHVDLNVMTASPYSICSVADFEILAQVIAMTNIDQVMAQKTTSERTKWNMKSFLLSEFGREVSRISKDGLFPNALESIHPAIRTPSGGTAGNPQST
jgi:hypothetical protein